MRLYMPQGHRDFLSAVERELNIGTFVRGQVRKESLRSAFSACLNALERFRNVHIQMVTKYVIIPAKKGRGTYEQTTSSVSIAGANGTGGTQPIEFLKSVRDDVIHTSRM
jgi:indoleamine 2,3-dioxygenase